MPPRARLAVVLVALLATAQRTRPTAAADGPATRPVATAPATTAPATTQPVATLDGPAGAAVAFSCDGTRLLTAGDRSVRVWDGRSFRPVTDPLDAGGAVRAAAVSREGRAVAAAVGDRVRAWDVDTGRPRFDLRHGGRVNAVAFDGPGRRVLTAGDDGTARLSDAGTGASLVELKHAAAVKGAWLSPDGQLVLTARVDPKMVEFVPWRGLVQQWDATTGVEVPFGERGPGSPDGAPINLPAAPAHRPVAFARLGHRVLVAFASHVIVNETRGGRMRELLDVAEVGGRATAVGYDADGRRALVVSQRGRVYVWDVASAELACPRFGDGVTDAALTPDGTRAVTVGPGPGDTAVWDVSTGERIWTVLPPDGAAPADVPALAIHPDGTRFALSYPAAGRTVVWPVPDRPANRPPPPDLAAEWRPARKLAGPTGTTVTFSRDGRRLLTAGGGEARVWDPAAGRPVGDALRPGHPVRHAALSADGARVLTVGEREVRVWDVAAAKPLATVRRAEAVRAAALSPDGSRLVTAANGESEVAVRDAATGDVVHRLPHPAEAFFAGFAPDGSFVLTQSLRRPGGGDGDPDDADARDRWVRQVAVVWDAATGRELRRRAVEDVSAVGDHLTASAAFSPDGRTVATFSFRCVDVWDATTGKVLASMDTLDEGTGTSSMVFSPDGRRILTLDGFHANLWDAARGELVVRLRGAIGDAAFSPDGRLVVTAGQFEGAGLWDLRTGRPIMRFRGREHTAVPAVAVSPDGRRFAVGYGEEGETTIYER